MTIDTSKPGPVLAIDIGRISTRAILFDLIDKRYRLVGVGKGPTTLGAYGANLHHGVRMALEELQAVTGRGLINAQKDLLQPVTAEGNGVNQCVITVSAGPPLTAFLLGLLPDISLNSASHLANSASIGLIKTYYVNEDWKPVAILNEILRTRPDIIILSGGTDGGSSRSVMLMIEPVRLAFLRLPDEYRPEVLFVGNQDLHPEILAAFNHSTHLHLAPNIRPDLDLESLDAAIAVVSKITIKIRVRQLPGLSDLVLWTQGNILPAPAGLGRVVRFLSQAHGSKLGVLGVDAGASAMTIAAGFEGRLALGVYPEFGLAGNLLQNPDALPVLFADRWLVDMEASKDLVLEYQYNKSIYPASLPLTIQELAIQDAIVQGALHNGMQSLARDFPREVGLVNDGLLPGFEPILATGDLISNIVNPGRACLLLLDGLQPTGITTLVLDPHQIAASMGVLAAINPVLAVQVLDSDAFLHLATVITPIGHAPQGTPILRVKTTIEDGHETIMDVKQGELEVIPLPPGKTARLQLQPFQRYDIGMGGAGRGGSMRVVGSVLGIVIDGRGRPIQVPDDLNRRRELFRKWLWTLGG
jgi:hypothetical protein